MKNLKVAKGVIIFIIISSCFLSLFATEKCDSDSNVIYVNIAYPYVDGDGSVDDPYRSIQQAIDVANEGDTIYVFEGQYNETLRINKKISIYGLNMNNTIVDRGDARHRYLIEITADHVTFENLTISDTERRNLVALIHVTSDYVTIQGTNITKSNRWGIYLDFSSDNTIGNNVINDTKGIYSYHSDNNVFSNNDFDLCSEAAIKLVNSDNNIMYNNSFDDNNYAIYAQYCSGTNISNNSIDNSSFESIKLYGGSNNTVKYNSITNGSGDGVYMGSSDSEIIGNTFIANQRGITLIGSNCLISSNVIRNSTLQGIYAEAGSTNNIIYLDTFINNNINAQDDGNNRWYSDTQGNYWDDYNALDRNLDGIGDTPYTINGNSMDMYPLGYFLEPPYKPSGPSPLDGAESVGLSVTLSVNVSDADNDTLDVCFYRASDDKLYGVDYGVSSGGRASCSFSLPFQTTFPWYAIANDSQLENRSDIWIFTTQQIPPSNQKPVADPSGPYTAVIGEAVTFDASGSDDPDGEIDFYRWNFGDGSSEILDTSPTHVYSDTGTYTVTLTIVDNDGRSDTAQTTVTVATSSQNQKPVAVVGGPYSGKTGESISFDGSGSYDTDGTIVSYSWDFGEGGAGTGISTTYNYSSAGTYIVTLYVTDDDGDVHYTSTTVTVESSSSGVIPGFEFMFAVVAIAFALLWKKHKGEKN